MYFEAGATIDYIKSASDVLENTDDSADGIDFSSGVWRGRRAIISLYPRESFCTKAFGIEHLGYGNTINQLDEIVSDVDVEVPPTARAIVAARAALSGAFRSSPFPRGHVTEDEGGICVAWTRGTAAVHLVIHASDPTKDHIFHDDGKSFGAATPVSGPVLAHWIQRLIAA